MTKTLIQNSPGLREGSYWPIYNINTFNTYLTLCYGNHSCDVYIITVVTKHSYCLLYCTVMYSGVQKSTYPWLFDEENKKAPEKMQYLSVFSGVHRFSHRSELPYKAKVQ